jgi:hypothetical protein
LHFSSACRSRSLVAELVDLVFKVEEDDQGLMAGKSPLVIEASGRMLVRRDVAVKSARVTDESGWRLARRDEVEGAAFLRRSLVTEAGVRVPGVPGYGCTVAVLDELDALSRAREARSISSAEDEIWPEGIRERDTEELDVA